MKNISKRLLSCLLAAALLITCGVSGLVLPAAAETSVLKEDFEGSSTISAISNWVANGEITADPVDATNKALRVTTAMSNAWSLGKFGLQGGKVYALKLRAYGGSVVINTNNGSSKGITGPVSNKAVTGDAWKEVAYLFRTWETTKNDGYSIKMNATVGTYIDDIELIELGDATENYLVDGTFDLPVSYDYSGFWNAAINGGASVQDAPNESGNKALYFPSSFTKHAAKYYGAIVNPAWEKGETYEVSMRIYGGPISLYLNHEKGITEGSSWYTLTADDYTTWTTVKHTFTFGESKATNDSYVFAIGIANGVETNGTYVDDIVITKKAADPATAITLNKTELTLGVGGKETLTVTPVPENGTLDTVVWTTDNEAVATVVNGEVTAVSVGTAKITATAGALTASCTVNVPLEATAIGVTHSALHLAPGAAKTVLAVAEPVGAAMGTLTWATSDAAVATVEKGKITAVANGTATITVSNGKLSATVNVTVSDNGEAITGGDFENDDWNVPLWTTNLIKDGAGSVVTEADGNKVLQLKPSANAVYFQNAPVKGNTTYRLTYQVKGGTVRTSISGSHAASGSGWANTTPTEGEWTTITRVFTTKASPNKNYILAIGATTATPTYIDNVSLVALPAATALKLDKTAETVNHNQTLQLTVSTEPADANAGTLTWTSSNEAVATVDQNGLVTAVASGEAVITVSNGTLSATCTVTVPLIAETFTLKEQSLHFAVGTYKTLTVVTENNLSAGELSWKSSDDAVATVVNGKVTAVADGTATITATNYKNVTATVTVKVDTYGERLSGGDFENGDWNHATLTTNMIKDGKCTLITEADGNNAMQIPADLTSTLYFAPAPIAGGKTYVVTMQAKGKTLRTHVIGTHNAAGDLGEKNFTLKADEWTTVKFVFTTKASPNKNYAIGISNKSGEPIVVDNITWAELPDAEGLVITPDTVELLPNGTSTLKVSAVPELSNMGTVTWSSSAPNVVSVDQNGNIAAVGKSGTATISATNDKGKTATVTVKINEYANLLTNGDFELGNTLYYNGEANLSELILPGIGKDGSYGLRMHNTSGKSKTTTYYRKALPLDPGTTYVLSFDYIATADENIRLWSGTMGFGNIYTGTGKSEWKTAVKVFTTPADMALNTNWDLGIVCEGEGSEKSVIDNICLKLYNSGVDAQSITLSRNTMTLIPGRTGALSVHATPVEGDTNRMVWTSSDENVATVEYGVVTGVGKGTAIITGTTKNGKSASCTVTVSGNDTFILNGTFDDAADNSWTLTGATKAEGAGVSESTAIELGSNAILSQAVKGELKPDTEYQVIVRYRTPNKSLASVVLTDGTTKLVEGETGTSAYWKKSTFDFKTGETVPSALTLEIALKSGNGPVYIDNVILAQKASLIDLVVESIIWDGGDGEVKPGTKLTFATTIRNRGEDEIKPNQSFDVNVCLDGKVIQTMTYAGKLSSGDSTIVISESAWTAQELGDHVISAHVNPTLSVLEINDTNNTYQVNLRIAEERLTVPEQALEAGMTNLIFSDDFSSDATIDKYATGDHGYKWYVTAKWGNGTATPDDYTVENGILKLHRGNTPNNITLSTMDVNTGNGFSWNTGYLEFRIRVVDADGAQVNNVGNVPAIWSFPVGKHLETAGDNKHYVEMDWMEYWGLDTAKWPSRPGGYYTISLHDCVNGEGGLSEWYNNGGKSGRYQEGLGDEEWHVMGFRWEKGKLAAFYDGEKVFEQKWAEGFEPTPGATDMYNGALGDTTDVFTLIDQQFNILYLSAHEKNPMEVDYIRIWQGDGSIISPDDPVEDEDTPVGDVIIDIEPEQFWYNYCTDDWGDPIASVNGENYLNVLAGQEVWAALTDARRQEINAYLAEKGQPTFDELLAAALKLQEGDEESPDTGVATALPIAMAAAAVSAAGLWISRKRKH